MSRRFLFPLLICAAVLASSSLNSADAAPKGASCVISVGANPCDAGLSCIPTNVGRTTGICCPRWHGPRPAEMHRGRVVRWNSANAELTSFFSDDQHLSAAGQLIEANYVHSLIVTPLPAALPLFAT